MPRGPDAGYAELFSAAALPALRTACAELSWLLSRGYAETSALALVGDRHRLRKRQRTAVSRSACSDDARTTRRARRRDLGALGGASLAIDGFNCVITVEAALSGGVLLHGRDSALRDLASVHGSYRRIDVADEALRRIVAELSRHRPARVRWWLDRPVSNSGRLAEMLRAVTSGAPGIEWSVELDYDPDGRLREHEGIVASSDSLVLDHCRAWIDVPAAVVAGLPDPGWRIDLDVDTP